MWWSHNTVMKLLWTMGHMMIIYVAIQGTAKFFSTADLACYISIGSVQVFQFLYILIFFFLF